MLVTQRTARRDRLRRHGFTRRRNVLTTAFAADKEVAADRRRVEHGPIIGEHTANTSTAC